MSYFWQYVFKCATISFYDNDINAHGDCHLICRINAWITKEINRKNWMSRHVQSQFDKIRSREWAEYTHQRLHSIFWIEYNKSFPPDQALSPLICLACDTDDKKCSDSWLLFSVVSKVLRHSSRCTASPSSCVSHKIDLNLTWIWIM